jgi:hypothetical protein
VKLFKVRYKGVGRGAQEEASTFLAWDENHARKLAEKKGREKFDRVHVLNVERAA